MIALDYVLYDNRTWSPRWGRDWGLKAATGALAARGEMRTAFDRYCGALPGEDGRLHGFGEALGGIRTPAGDGYLLCVTLESSDSFGRPSWAVFGLWCPDRATLGRVLAAGDPIGSARALLGGETPPDAVEIRAAKTEAVPRRSRRPTEPTAFHRFVPGSTAQSVTSLLLGAVRSGTTLPNVLGITAASRLAAVAREGFDVVYCHPLDDRAERALARVQSPQVLEVEVEKPAPAPAGPTTPVADGHSRRQGRAAGRLPVGLVAGVLSISLAVVITAAGWLLVRDFLPGATPGRDAWQPSFDHEALAPGGSSLPPEDFERHSAEAALAEVRERLEECKALVPEALRRTPGFLIAETIEVLPRYEDRRSRVRQAYARLIEVRARMVKRQGNYVAYYFDEGGKDTAPATRLQKIAAILGEAPLGGDDCKVLEEAFGFEFERGASVVDRWCDSLRRLEVTAAQSLSIPPAASGRQP